MQRQQTMASSALSKTHNHAQQDPVRRSQTMHPSGAIPKKTSSPSSSTGLRINKPHLPGSSPAFTFPPPGTTASASNKLADTHPPLRSGGAVAKPTKNEESSQQQHSHLLRNVGRLGLMNSRFSSTRKNSLLVRRASSRPLNDSDRYVVAFGIIDSDNSGTITSSELNEALLKLGFDVKPEEVLAIAKEHSCELCGCDVCHDCGDVYIHACICA